MAKTQNEALNAVEVKVATRLARPMNSVCAGTLSSVMPEGVASPGSP